MLWSLGQSTLDAAWKWGCDWVSAILLHLPNLVNTSWLWRLCKNDTLIWLCATEVSFLEGVLNKDYSVACMVMGQPKYISTRVSYQEGSRCPELCSNMLCFHPVGDAKMEAYHEGWSKEVSYSLTWSPIYASFLALLVVKGQAANRSI